MFSPIALSEIIACSGTGAGALYLTWRKFRRVSPLAILSPSTETDVLELQSRYGYNEHSFVGVSVQNEIWKDGETGGIVSYTARGRVWVVAGEPLGREEDLAKITHRFLEYASTNRRIAVFLPTTEKFAKIMATADARIVKVGASPYFDLEHWDPRGNAAKKLRLGLNHGRKAGVCVEEVTAVTDDFRHEAERLGAEWADHRRAGVRFGWLFELAPFRYSAAKKYFAARTPDGKLKGLLAASPIPARNGWYLEDVLRSFDAPAGTADLLVFEVLKTLAAQGATLATLGTVPLSEKGLDEVSKGRNRLVEKAFRLCRRHLTSLYNFKGLETFKSKFVPTWWESEYVIASKGVLIPPRVANAVLGLIIPGGLLHMIRVVLFDDVS